MDDTTLQDLKQFIAATVSQEIAEVRQDIDKLDKKLSQRIDDRTEEILAAVGESTETRFGVIEEDVKDLQTRVTNLEAA